VILDLFSRYVTGWMVTLRESAELAKRLIEESCQKQGIRPGQLTLHADRGTSMTSKPVAFLLADLGVTKTHSRPHVSNDNPYSESQFRTLKYRPEFPDRFGCLQDSRAFCQGFFRWYNQEHRHSGLGLLTPAMVHYGQAASVLRQRQAVLDVAYQLHPERFVRSAFRRSDLITFNTAGWIVPESRANPEVIDSQSLVCRPTGSSAGRECPCISVVGLDSPLCWEFELLCQAPEFRLIADGVVGREHH